jgi:hypothetical protein
VIGDRVWRDANSNGLQDPGEPGAAGVTVSLYGDDDALVGSTSTDELGAYEFADLRSGSYFLTFVALQDNRFTRANAGDDDEADSDADPTTGQTVVFDFDSSQPDLKWDAGLVLSAATETPQPPLPPEVPTPTPVVPSQGGKYKFTVTFVRVSGDCGLPETFVDTLEVDISAVDPTTGGQTGVVSQASTHDENTGPLQSDGKGEASSPRESYSYTLEFVRDETGLVVRVILTGLNTYTDTNGCVTVYEIEGLGELVEE